MLRQTWFKVNRQQLEKLVIKQRIRVIEQRIGEIRCTAAEREVVLLAKSVICGKDLRRKYFCKFIT